MKNIVQHMSIYTSHHQKLITKVTHFIGIPAIILAIQIVLDWLHVPFLHSGHITVAWIAVSILLIYYAFLDVYLSLAAVLFLVPLTYAGHILGKGHFNSGSLLLFLILFILGWVLQLVGHYFEGKRPAFLHNAFQLLIAPIFLTAELLFALGLRKELQRKIDSAIR
ncbi:hypothetical protein AQUSIP_24560 [Aquicella siphonis]|uniref:DUF962 domain-containing protein n=1 Tax=Aquicella siphonis TaxID=254247 RepID=A0A5E4PJ80_9COXI|nr:Mpo1-like protein [Aquicella siphonis]VVC77129.1 hypothetical protein AQUSIP_24560 [Aquicella siphonis]